MFTGLVEAVGSVRELSARGRLARLVVRQAEIAGDAALGESVSVSGACLTVANVSGPDVTFDVVGETLERTTLGALKPGDKVNLERALRVGSALGGHLVQGHVDGVSTVEAVETVGEWQRARFKIAPELTSFMVEKGSVAVDGVSLTLAEVSAGAFAVALIPTTLANTTLGALRPGDRVNVETDLIAKYVAKLLGKSAPGGVSLETLMREGFA